MEDFHEFHNKLAVAMKVAYGDAIADKFSESIGWSRAVNAVLNEFAIKAGMIPVRNWGDVMETILKGMKNTGVIPCQLSNICKFYQEADAKGNT